MDLRIVNTCNNDCLYCLEQWLRKRKKFIRKEEIFKVLERNFDREILCFYGWNPLLHPDLEEIISFAKSIWYKNISLLTNTFWVSENFLKSLKNFWLSGISFYFNSFFEENHNFINWNGISLKKLLENIFLLKKYWFNLKCIIHINNQNIENTFENILILNKKFWISDFEFIKYHLVSRAKKFENILKIDINKEKKLLKKIGILSKKLNINVNFKKF